MERMTQAMYAREREKEREREGEKERAKDRKKEKESEREFLNIPPTERSRHQRRHL